MEYCQLQSACTWGQMADALLHKQMPRKGIFFFFKFWLLSTENEYVVRA